MLLPSGQSVSQRVAEAVDTDMDLCSEPTSAATEGLRSGKLEPGEGETTQAVRRRLNAAAETLGVSLEIRRTAGAVYSWASEGRRRGRPRKESGA